VKSLSNDIPVLGKRSQVSRVEFLDGIRGWASILVLLSHIIGGILAFETPELDAGSLPGFKDSPWNGIYGLLLRLFTDGHLAVLIFFVLSGYALSVSHFNLQKNTLALATASRYFRLMIPIFFTSLIAYLMLKLGLFFNLDAAARSPALSDWLGSFYKFRASIYGAVWFSLYGVFFRYRDDATYNSSLWTMPVELMGSFLVYGFLAIFRRSTTVQWRISVLLTLAFLCSTPLYACFTLGYLIAESNKNFAVSKRRKGSDFFLICVFVGVSVFSTFPQFRGDDEITYDMVTCLIATALVGTVSFSSMLRGFFSNSLSRFLGKISFPLYLIQIIVICSWSSYLYLNLPLLCSSPSLAALINLLTTVLLCIGLSVLLLPIERFSISASKKLGSILLMKGSTLFFRESRASAPPA
jgi:peptidoglycan/LPS O-acetylase OafA/YrhL